MRLQISGGQRSALVLLMTAGLGSVAHGFFRNPVQPAPAPSIEYRVLATNRTSTMEKELNAAAESGFRFQSVMGGDTVFGGSEVVAIVSRALGEQQRYTYKLLAASRTSTMERELQSAADAGFHYRGQTVFDTTFGGDEVVVILERDSSTKPVPFEYRLVATSRTATLQNELTQVGRAGFAVVGMTVSETTLGGKEIVVIMRRPRIP